MNHSAHDGFSPFSGLVAGKILFLALLYILTGKLGLMLAVPPGYATVIWPPSGIALGILLVHGWRLWPGVLIGSFLLNCYISGAYVTGAGLNETKALVAFAIACGSTVQALVGYLLIARFVGLPLKLNRIREPFLIFLLAAPAACLIAATVGTASLYFAGAVSSENLATNWQTWWLGDVFGVLVFLPLALLAPGGGARLRWRGAALGSLPALAMLILLLPLGLTFYGWKLASESAYQQGQSEFATLALESEKALLQRLSSYQNALLGGEGFFQGSQNVSRDEWRSYIEALNLEKNFPGINGIGFIRSINPGELASYEESMRASGIVDFKIYPQTSNIPNYIITYIEPQRLNRIALGLNIAFENNRLQAATLSRDSGQSAITRKIQLVQDYQKTPGFLLLHPMYRQGLPVTTAQERQAALLGWIYAPFIAKNFMKDLTKTQGYALNLRIYDGDNKDNDALIFSSDNVESAGKSTFTHTKKIDVFQRTWTVQWVSTPVFEHTEKTANPLFILMGGLLFTAMCALFLMLTMVRNESTLERIAGKRGLVVPIAIFLLLAIGSAALYRTLHKKELQYIRSLVDKEVSKIELLITAVTDQKLSALKRMAQRWEAAGGTPYELWQHDAYNYTHDLYGIKTLEWVDKTYHVRWAEPLKGSERAIGLDILLDKTRAAALEGAAERGGPTVTPPLDLVQGYKGFIAYEPLLVRGKFDGFIAALFSIEELFSGAITKEIGDIYSIAIGYAGQEYYKDQMPAAAVAPEWSVEKPFQIYDQRWVMNITPTAKFVAAQKTSLPFIVMFAGFVIAALSALTARFVLLSRLKSSYLAKSSQLNTAILNSTNYLIISTEIDGTVATFNKAAEQALGYKAREVVGKTTPAIWHDEQEVIKRAEVLTLELGTHVIPGFDVFVRKTQNGGVDTNEWSFIRKDGSRFPASLAATALIDESGVVTGYLGVIEDITQRKEIARMKSEFISVVSHELRTPLTSIRGSLGLMAGTMTKEIPEKANRLIDIAHKNSERLILLINDMLDIDKIASGQMRFDLKEEAVESLVRQAVETNQPYADKFGVMIAAKAIDPTLHINVDAQRFLQVLANLLSNAAKFSKQGSTVDVSARAVGSFVRIGVKDSGPGIGEEFKSRIFSKFSQADSSVTRTKGGTGLGLHISKEITEHMAGRIGFDTQIGNGSTFWVEFPLATGPARGLELNSLLLHHRERTGHVPVMLHVEDDQDLSNMLTAALHGRVDVMTSTTLKHAERLLKDMDFSIVVLDVGMPDGSGLDLLEKMPTNSERKIPVLILSASDVPTEMHQKVDAVMIKSRMSETKIIDTILKLVSKNHTEG